MVVTTLPFGYKCMMIQMQIYKHTFPPQTELHPRTPQTPTPPQMVTLLYVNSLVYGNKATTKNVYARKP